MPVRGWNSYNCKCRARQQTRCECHCFQMIHWMHLLRSMDPSESCWQFNRFVVACLLASCHNFKLASRSPIGSDQQCFSISTALREAQHSWGWLGQKWPDTRFKTKLMQCTCIFRKRLLQDAFLSRETSNPPGYPCGPQIFSTCKAHANHNRLVSVMFWAKATRKVKVYGNAHSDPTTMKPIS